MVKARNVMTTDVISVTPETPIYEAITLLVENSLTGLPVVTEENELAGVISEKDVLRLLYDAPLEGEAVVSKYMTEDVVSYSDETDLVQICDKLIKSHFRRVPISKDDKLVGVISRSDIIKFILKHRK